MPKYRLIKTYPGSPKLGEIRDATDPMFYKDKPRDYPEYWQKMEHLYTVEDQKGHPVELYGSVWMIRNEEVVEEKLTPYNDTEPFWQFKMDALAELNRKISYEAEDGLVSGNQILYGVLPKAQWETVVTTSGHLWKRVVQGASTTAWKYFQSEGCRAEFIRYNKPQYSLKAVIEAFISIGVDFEVDTIESLLKK